MSWTTVERCLPHGFVDVCELFVRRPWVLIEPCESRPDGVARLERRVRGPRHARSVRIDMWPQPLKIESPSLATLAARWRSSHPHCGLGTGHALLQIEAMSKRGARTNVTLTIQRHRRITRPLDLATRRFNDLVHAETRRIVEIINRAMESDAAYDDDIWLTLLETDDVVNHAP